MNDSPLEWAQNWAIGWLDNAINNPPERRTVYGLSVSGIKKAITAHRRQAAEEMRERCAVLDLSHVHDYQTGPTQADVSKDYVNGMKAGIETYRRAIINLGGNSK